MLLILVAAAAEAGAGSGMYINTLRPKHNGRHFPDDILRNIFLNENIWISLKISLKFVPNVRINNSSIGSDNGLAPTNGG